MQTGIFPVYEVLIGVLLVVFLSWFAGISKHSGYAAVALVLLLWMLWAFKNASKITQFAQKAQGG